MSAASWAWRTNCRRSGTWDWGRTRGWAGSGGLSTSLQRRSRAGIRLARPLRVSFLCRKERDRAVLDPRHLGRINNNAMFKKVQYMHDHSYHLLSCLLFVRSLEFMNGLLEILAGEIRQIENLMLLVDVTQSLNPPSSYCADLT